MTKRFESGGESNGHSASASVLPVNIQGCFPLGWTDLISLQSKEDEMVNRIADSMGMNFDQTLGDSGVQRQGQG